MLAGFLFIPKCYCYVIIFGMLLILCTMLLCSFNQCYDCKVRNQLHESTPVEICQDRDGSSHDFRVSINCYRQNGFACEL